jgi:enamine deaminase RidA (YjgF/YER057c/UK114 family)
VFVAGQVGKTPDGTFHDGFGAQFRQVLENTVAILRTAGAGPEHLTRMTWYVTDLDQYNSALKDVGAAYGEIIGRHFPTMTVVEVKRLVYDKALVEIESTAVVPAGNG